MKYKMVVKTQHTTFIKKKSKNKEYLENLALELSTTHPRWKIYVVPDNFMI